MTTKLGRMVTNLEGPLPMLLNPLVMCSCKLTRETKTIISPEPQCLWSPNWVGVKLNTRVPHPS